MIRTERELLAALDATVTHLNALKKPVKDLIQAQRVFNKDYIDKRHKRLFRAIDDIENLIELHKIVGKSYIKKITK